MKNFDPQGTVNMLSPKRKAKWLKAMRSGKYKQGHGQLKTENKNGKPEFCCLGVLKEVVPRIKADGVTSLVPSSCGITGYTLADLINLNDAVRPDMTGRGRTLHVNSFKKIANWIEKHL